MGKYIAIGAGVLGALIFVVALAMRSGGDPSRDREGAEKKQPALSADSGTKTTAQAEEETRLKAMAATLEDKRKAEAAKLEEEKRKLAEERRKLEEARLAAEAEAKKKAEATTTKVDPPPVQPDVKTTQPDTKAGETPAVQADARAAKAQQAFSGVLKETASLLAQNKFADAIALLERKAKDPALADAAELLKQEKADVEGVVELRRQAVEAIRKLVGKQVTLKKGSGTISGKVVDDAKRDGITLNVGGPEMTIRADQVHADDIDQYAPKLPDAVENLRRRGLLFLYAGDVPKAKDSFTKAADAGGTPAVQTCLDRITALELGEIEAAALKAWEKAEKLFAAKDMKNAKSAYEAFERDHGKTQTVAKQAPALKDRYEAIEKVIGPAPQLSLDLGGGVKMEMVLVKAGDFMMGSLRKSGADWQGNEGPIHKVTITKPYYIGKYDVTVAQFRAFADAAKHQTEAEKQNKGWTMKDGKWQEVSGVHWRNPGFPQEDNHPVVVVTWNDAQEFCKWANTLPLSPAGRGPSERSETGVRGREQPTPSSGAKAPPSPHGGEGKWTVRLPTEAEWEYAARGPKGPKYPWGEKWEGVMANVADASLRRAGFNMQWGEIKEDDGYPFTSPGGAFRNASWCGAYDMAGNVWQWCQDWFSDRYYGESPAVDPQGPATGRDRVHRGGCWPSDPGYCRSARRNIHTPEYRDAGSGFRVVVGCGSFRTP